MTTFLRSCDPEWDKTIKNAFQVDTYYAQSDPTTPSFTAALLML